ncbi:MAG: excinuclease ABC subunit UvrA [Bacteroidaceae bacterium]|nr:excinuclease ABC subunit UvrA [Bacteroidaceae bacterium]
MQQDKETLSHSHSTPLPHREGQGGGSPGQGGESSGVGASGGESPSSYLSVIGARVNNLKNIDVTIPRNSLTVITGLSGSGKSSLACDTIYAEGQRRYIETFSAYARNFLGGLERPDVDKISGLSPVISIEQKTTNKNPRSTVGTTTEIYDFLRLLFARAGEAYSWKTGEKMVKYTEEQIVERIQNDYAGHRIQLLAPLVRNRKGHYRELLEQTRRRGFMWVRIDGEMQELVPDMKLDRYKNHSIEVVVDRMKIEDPPPTPPVREGSAPASRLSLSVSTAMKLGDGIMLVLDADTDAVKHYSRRLMCPTTGISYADPAPHNFSFNSPQGWCPRCKGLGFVSLIDVDKVIPDRTLSVHDGGIAPLGKAKQSMIFWQVDAILEEFGCTMKTPLSDVPDEAIDQIIYGSPDRLRIPASVAHTTNDYYVTYDGLAKYIEAIQDGDGSATAQKWAAQFSRTATCPECGGTRLNREATHYRIAGRNIADLSNMDIADLLRWVKGLEEETHSPLSREGESLASLDSSAQPLPSLTGGAGGGSLTSRQRQIAPEILKEIHERLQFLSDVGLTYLSLSRSSMSLSGGESQRIRLATQIGSKLVNVLYILDEPSIGLHQRDNRRLINSLKALRDTGNTVIVVEHDEEIMRAADWLIDIGPRAGRLGGEVMYMGRPTPSRSNRAERGSLPHGRAGSGSSLTLQYLSGELQIEIPATRRPTDKGVLRLCGCTGNNLKDVTVDFPLGILICVTGVSGSGKSTLVNDTLQPILSQHFYHSLRDPLPYKSIEGLDQIDKIVDVDQSPIGRTPRSNPATYTGVFNDIRNLFVELPEARIRGYKPGRFSFNVKGGRCETCGGNGYKSIEMNFLPDVTVPCEECRGRRYNRETLEVRFRGKSIADVLDMTINQAVEFFENQPNILQKIKTLQEVGLGYLKLGQSSTTLSGGESQHVKLATELARRDTGRTLYILDEPTTGLHFEDIRALLLVLQRLVERGNTVIVIEHNLDVIKSADYIIDMGPEGGRDGGTVVATGTPEQVAASGKGFTSHFLSPLLSPGGGCGL